MGRFLGFLVFFVLLAAAFVLIGLPLLLGPVLTGMVRDAGLKSDTLSVSVALFDPTLLLGKARKITLVATGVDASPAHIGNVNLAIGEASLLRSVVSRRFTATLDDVSSHGQRHGQCPHWRHLGRWSGQCRRCHCAPLCDRHGPADPPRGRACRPDDRQSPRRRQRRHGQGQWHRGQCQARRHWRRARARSRRRWRDRVASARAIGSVVTPGSVGVGRRPQRPGHGRRREHDRQPERVVQHSMIDEPPDEPTRHSRDTRLLRLACLPFLHSPVACWPFADLKGWRRE